MYTVIDLANVLKDKIKIVIYRNSNELRFIIFWFFTFKKNIFCKHNINTGFWILKILIWIILSIYIYVIICNNIKYIYYIYKIPSIKMGVDN